MAGNQKIIRTSTGEWHVDYNAENRPKGSQKVECKYDFQGRRVEKSVYGNGLLQKRLRFIYIGYLQIAALDITGTTPELIYTLHWDPTELSATRPLVMVRGEDYRQKWYEYTHSMNKNVSCLTDHLGIQVASYEYNIFGNLVKQTGILAENNPFRCSSEYFDSELGLVYYNYRHYNPRDGRWINRDPLFEKGGLNLYQYCRNNAINYYDQYGLFAFLPFVIVAAVGAVISVAGQAISDYKNDKEFEWENYAGAAAGGAVGGLLSLYNPLLGNVVGGAITPLLQRSLKGDFDNPTEAVADSVVGAANGVISLGLSKGIKIPGLNSGRNSVEAVCKSTITKSLNGTINKISTKTAGKIALSRIHPAGTAVDLTTPAAYQALKDAAGDNNDYDDQQTSNNIDEI